MGAWLCCLLAEALGITFVTAQSVLDGISFAMAMLNWIRRFISSIWGQPCVGNFFAGRSGRRGTGDSGRGCLGLIGNFFDGNGAGCRAGDAGSGCLGGIANFFDGSGGGCGTRSVG